MPATPEQVLDLIDDLIRRSATTDPLGAARVRQLKNIRSSVADHGFPPNQEENCKLSIVPLVFQEANYDDLDWSDQNADLGHLTDYFAIDLYLYSGGRTRDELSDTEFRNYFDSALRCIDRWQAGAMSRDPQ